MPLQLFLFDNVKIIFNEVFQNVLNVGKCQSIENKKNVFDIVDLITTLLPNMASMLKNEIQSIQLVQQKVDFCSQYFICFVLIILVCS
jgi:hypothetical protein